MRESNSSRADALASIASATRAGPWERYKGLMELMGGVVAFAVVVYGALYVIVLLAGAWWGFGFAVLEGVTMAYDPCS